MRYMLYWKKAPKTGSRYTLTTCPVFRDHFSLRQNEKEQPIRIGDVIASDER